MNERQSLSFPVSGTDGELQNCGYKAQWDPNYASDPHISRTFNPSSESATPSFTTTVAFKALVGSGGRSYMVGIDWITTGFCIFTPYYDSPSTQWALVTVPLVPYGANMVNAANAFYKHETCKFFGYGGEGCAASFNWIANNAIGRTFGTRTYNVPYVHAGLISAGLASVDQGQALAGDVAIAPDDRHIGICMNNGCTTILSNSSTPCTFSWQSDGNFDGYYATYGSPTYLTWPKVLN